MGEHMPFEPGPVQVVRVSFSSNAEVIEDLSRLDFWPSTCMSEWMVYIVGNRMAPDLLDALEVLPSDTRAPSAEGVSP